MRIHLVSVFADAWSAETAAPGTSFAGPLGQCAVTALVVQDLMGGVIVRAQLADGSHYWNRFPGVGDLDLTRGQYPDDYPMPVGYVVSRARLLEGDRAVAARTADRYMILSSRVVHILRAQS